MIACGKNSERLNRKRYPQLTATNKLCFPRGERRKYTHKQMLAIHQLIEHIFPFYLAILLIPAGMKYAGTWSTPTTTHTHTHTHMRTIQLVIK